MWDPTWVFSIGSAREIASIVLPAARERHAKNVWHIALRRGSTPSLSHFREPYGTASVAPMWFSIVLSLLLRGGSTSSLSHFLELYGAASVAPMWFSIVLSLLWSVIPSKLTDRCSDQKPAGGFIHRTDQYFFPYTPLYWRKTDRMTFSKAGFPPVKL